MLNLLAPPRKQKIKKINQEGGEDVISWITALLPRPMLSPATVGASVPRLVIQYTNYKYALASLIYNTRQ